MADVVVHVAADRATPRPALAPIMRQHGHAELHDFGPERVVVVLAVEAVEVLVRNVLLQLWKLRRRILVGQGPYRATHAAGDVDGLEPQSLHRKLELRDAFFGGIERNASDRRESIAI